MLLHNFYTLLVNNSIHCWYTRLYSVGEFLHNCVHCWNTILYIVGAHLYLMLEHISIHCRNSYPCTVGRLLYIVGWYFYPCSWHQLSSRRFFGICWSWVNVSRGDECEYTRFFPLCFFSWRIFSIHQSCFCMVQWDFTVSFVCIWWRWLIF